MADIQEAEIEDIALTVAALMRDKLDGDLCDPETWATAGREICHVRVEDDGLEDDGYCITIGGCDDPCPSIMVFALGDKSRPAYLARVLCHEIAHAVLRKYDPLTFTENPFTVADDPRLLAERICRATERVFFGSFGRCDLPENKMGSY